MSETPKSNSGATGVACGSAGLSGLAAAMGLCCYGSLAVALVGVSGAAAFSRFEPYRPFVLMAAGALLAWAFWSVYRRPYQGLVVQIILWASLALLLGSFFLPELAPLFINVLPGEPR